MVLFIFSLECFIFYFYESCGLTVTIVYGDITQRRGVGSSKRHCIRVPDFCLTQRSVQCVQFYGFNATVFTSQPYNFAGI